MPGDSLLISSTVGNILVMRMNSVPGCAGKGYRAVTALSFKLSIALTDFCRGPIFNIGSFVARTAEKLGSVGPEVIFG